MLKNKFKPVGTIYETTDYDAFTLLDFNRDAKPRKDLLDALDENGRFYEHMIVNENLEVLDGQHRLLSAKLKKKPITFYIVDKNTAEQVIKSVNTERKNWTVREYIDFYRKLGYEDYAVLDEYINSDYSSKLPDSMIYEVLAGAGWQFPKIKSGSYKTLNLANAPEVLNFMLEVMEKEKGKMSVRLGRAIRQIYPKKNINKDRLLKVLKLKKTHSTVKGMSEGDAIDYILTLYNKNLTTNYVEYYFTKGGSLRIVQ